MLAKTTPPGMMSFVFSLKQTGVPLGGALAGAVVPALVLWAGWRVGRPGGGLRPASPRWRSPSRCAPRSTPTASRRRRLAASGLVGPLRYTLGDPTLRRLAFCSFFFAALQLCLITYLVTYLTANLGFTLVQAGMMLAVAQGGGVVARIVWGAVADRGAAHALLGLVGARHGPRRGRDGALHAAVAARP